MANTIQLTGEVRDQFGKGAARRMRVAQEIPATIYAGGAQPDYIKLPMRETTLALRRANALFSIEFDGKTKMAVVKDVQRNPVKRIDTQNLQVRADVSNLPERIDISVEGLSDGDKVLAKDIKLPEGSELIIDDLEDSIVSVEIPKEEAAAPEAGAASAEGGAEGAASSEESAE